MSTLTVTCTVFSSNPFSDKHIIDDVKSDRRGTVSEEIDEQSVTDKTTYTVPILDSLPHLEPWRSPSPASAPRPSPSPTQSSLKTPIRWTDADLSTHTHLTTALNPLTLTIPLYLLTILFPSPILSSRLFFSPPLHSLPSTSLTPISLTLTLLLPPTPPPGSAFSPHLPIGTGRPVPRTLLLAASSPASYSAHDARRTLASSLLRDSQLVADMWDRYTLLNALYDSSTATLQGLYRGMIEMLGVSEREWEGRYVQLSGAVDESCGLGARLEVFLLEVGRREVEGWVGLVEIALGLENGERGDWSEVYGDAVEFLGRAIEEAGCA